MPGSMARPSVALAFLDYMYIIAYVDLFFNRSAYKIINKNRSTYLCNLTLLTKRDIMAIERIEHYEN